MDKEHLLDASARVSDECFEESFHRQHGVSDSAVGMLRHTKDSVLLRGVHVRVPAALLLWSMLRCKPRLIAVMIEMYGVNLRSFETQVEDELLRIGDRETDAFDFSDITEVVLSARTEATLLGDSHLGSEHLLLALCRTTEVGTLLGSVGITYDRVKSILECLINDECFEESFRRQHGLTDSATSVLRHARDTALLRGLHGPVPVVCLLWSILKGPRRLGVVMIEMCGVDLRSFEKQVEDELLRAGDRNADAFDFSDITAVVQSARAEATLLGHSYLGTEHLVLALCRTPKVGRLLGSVGATYDRLKTNLECLLTGPAPE